MKRSQFIKIAGVAAFSTLTGQPTKSAASPADTFENSSHDNLVDLTPDVAFSIAESLDLSEGASQEPSNNTEWVAEFCVPFYDTQGQASGFIVYLNNASDDTSFVVIDPACPGSIAEFGRLGQSATSLTRDAVPLLSTEYKGTDTTALDEPSQYVVRRSPGLYQLQTDDGALQLQGAPTEQPDTHDANKPTIWNSIFVSMGDTIKDYICTESTYIKSEPICVSEYAIESNTKRYACFVTAMYAMGQYLGAVNSVYSSWNDYLSLWTHTNTQFDHESNGITYGVNYPSNSSDQNGLVNFCKSKGKTVSATFYNQRQSWSTYSSWLASGSIFCINVGIIDSSTYKRSGHTMACEAVASYTKKVGSGTVSFIGVYDGWNDYLRYINYDYSNFTDYTVIRYG